MIRSRDGRFRQIKKRYAVGTLLCLCVLWLVPFARGKSDNVDTLIGQLKDERTQVRLRAAVALAKIKDSRAVEPLIAALSRS